MTQRVAICLHGAISKIERNFYEQGTLYLPGKYVNIKVPYNSIRQHIINSNPNCSFDFFIHSWNEDLKQELVDLYQPCQFLFENNTSYNSEINSIIKSAELFTGASRALSIKKSIELLQLYSAQNSLQYDRVIIYRPDLILLKNIVLDSYDVGRIYVNNVNELNKLAGMGEGQADFHFIMNFEHALQFKELYAHITKGNPVKHHFWFKNYVNNFMHQKLIEDDIHAGFHQEVLRKIFHMVQLGRVSRDALHAYGLSNEEINSYTVH